MVGSFYAESMRDYLRNIVYLATTVKKMSQVVAMLTIASTVTLMSCEQKRHMIGSVNTEFKLIGPDHKIVIESYDDPKIEGITVFVSKSQTGGIKGALGLAEDTSDASVAIRQTGPIKVKEEGSFRERRGRVN